MYLRLVHAKVKPEMVSLLPIAYEERIIPRLQEMSGCLYAGLIMSAAHEDECISMTLWDTRKQAEEYEKSGLFDELLAEARPYLLDSSVWRVQLSEESKLECQPASVSASMEGAADAEAAAKLKGALQASLPAVLKVSMGMKGRLEGVTESVKASIEGVDGRPIPSSSIFLTSVAWV